MASWRAVQVAVEDGVARVELVGPGPHNSMGPDFWREMPVRMAELDADEAVRVVVISGRGRVFSAGLDLGAMMTELGPLLQGPQMASGRRRLLALIERYQRAIGAVEACTKPVIAAIAGPCIGGGVDLITACDVRLCAADAVFSVREVKLAIVADVGTLQRLPRIVGQGVARELALSGRDLDGAEAERVGLVNRCLPDREALDEAVDRLAAEIAANPPLAVQGTKRVLNWCADHSVAEGLEYVALWNAAQLQSEDLLEAMAAFAQKRAPVFKGR